MTRFEYDVNDFRYIAAGAAVLASGGGGSYHDAVRILDELAQSGWAGTVSVRDYEGAANACVLALMGSPDAAENLTLVAIEQAITNTIHGVEGATAVPLACVIPVEIGPINSLIPLIAAALPNNTVSWVVDGDGAGRAVPMLPQTTYSGSTTLLPSPCALANDTHPPAQAQSAVLTARTAAQVERLAGGVVSAFGSVSGIALWPSNASNGYALSGHYLPGTLAQTHALGEYLLTAALPPWTVEVAAFLAECTGRETTPIATNFYITAVTQSTTDASLDAGMIRLDDSPDPVGSTETCSLYNLNENLIMYSSLSAEPSVIAPDSICYYSESTGRGFSNAIDDLATYFDFDTGKSTGATVSVIKVAALPAFYRTPGVLASFADLLRDIGYAGALPYAR